MPMSRFRGPVRRSRGGFTLHLSDDEVDMLRRLLAELDELLAAAEGDAAGPVDDPDEALAAHRRELARRLFPVAHPDEPEMEAEYQRLMRSELVASRREAIATVDEILFSGDRLDEGRLTAFMQSINAVRLVLGTMLDLDEDPAHPEIAPGAEDTAEYHLYGYLSWLLEWTVRALTPTLDP